MLGLLLSLRLLLLPGAVALPLHLHLVIYHFSTFHLDFPIDIHFITLHVRFRLMFRRFRPCRRQRRQRLTLLLFA